jgi:hypothetical protein
MNEFTPLEKLHVRTKIQAVVLEYYSRKQEQVASPRQPMAPHPQDYSSSTRDVTCSAIIFSKTHIYSTRGHFKYK